MLDQSMNSLFFILSIALPITWAFTCWFILFGLPKLINKLKTPKSRKQY